MENKSRLYLVIAVGAIILGLVFLKKRSSQSSTLLTENNVAPSIQIIDEKKPEELKKAGEEYMKAVHWEQVERSIDLKRLPLNIVNGEATLDVEIKTVGTCFAGDADAIGLELKANQGFKLLATVEAISEGGTSLSWEVPREVLEKGLASNQFRLPVKEEPAQYGFYLCTALFSEKSCRSKKAKDLNEVFTQHIRKDAVAGKETRNIFFQYFMVDKKGLAAFSNVPRGNKNYEELKKYVQERQMKGNAAQEIDAAKNNMQTLISYPFQFDGNKLRIELPQYSLSACAKARK